MYGPQGNFNENAVKGFEEVVEGDVNAGMYPDISTDAWADYRDALDEVRSRSRSGLQQSRRYGHLGRIRRVQTGC